MPKKTSFLKQYTGLVIILVLLVGGVTVALVVGVKDDTKKKPNSSNQQVVNTSCGPYGKDGVTTIKGQRFDTEIAYTNAAKVKGLSGRPCILASQGLLMDFGKDGNYEIWMKDMKFPIDVIWIGSNHKIAAIEINFQPSTYDNQNPQKSERRVNQIPARYVLEVKANTAKNLHWGLGTAVSFQKT